MTRRPHPKPSAKPVIHGLAPIGRAATRGAAIRLALQFLLPVERALIDAGYRLTAWEGASHFRTKLTR